MKSTFITIEGIEGCGKTTQTARLVRYLRALGFEVDETREPGGTPISEDVREILLDPIHAGMTPLTELLLYSAARAQHVAERIRPALEDGKVVVCDRFADSSMAYQGGGRGVDPEVVRSLYDIATEKLVPHLTFLIDVTAEEGVRRSAASKRADRIETEPIEFHERVRQTFLDAAKAEPARMKVIDGMQAQDAVFREIMQHVRVFRQGS